jgi:hypothetical protein
VNDREKRKARREDKAQQGKDVAAREMQFRSNGAGGDGTANDDANDYSDRLRRRLRSTQLP